MIKAIKDLNGVRLIIAGIGSDSEMVEKYARKCKKIQYIGWVPSYEGIIKKTLEADILFRFSDPKIPKTKYESPNKLFEAMMCGKPIIVTEGASMSDIVKNVNCGLVVPYGDTNAIKEAISRLRSDLELCQLLGRNGRRAYKEKYSWDIMEERLINAYKGLEKSRRLRI